MNTTHAMEQVDDGQHTQEGVSTERAFEADPIPSLSETITARAIAASFILGVALCAVAMKISLNSGFLPSLTVPAGLVGFYLVRAWIRALDCCFQVPHQLPFTRQENTVIQTCVVACSAITFSGGFGTYILAMGKNAAGGDVRDGKNIVEPSIGRTVAFLFLVSFSGMFVLMPFRKVMIIRHRLTYPNGMATAHLINSFHTPQGASKARQQVEMLFRSLGGTMLWNMFQWFFAAAKGCGFGVFPIFGLEAYKHGFYFDFSMSNIGIGMLCPYTITVSMFIGSVVSWGLVSPYLATKAGVWYSSHLSPSSLSGIRGYKVFIGVSMILADGLFNFLSIVAYTLHTMRKRRSRQQPIIIQGGGCGGGSEADDGDTQPLPFHCLNAAAEQPKKSFDDRRRAQVFLRDHISNSVNIACYVLLSMVSVAAIPYLYPQMRRAHVALIYLAAPVVAFCDAYAFGVTDMNLSSTYGKLAMVLVGSSVGRNDGGVVAGLVACGIVMGTMSNANNLMQDLKTGYLTLTSPHTDGIPMHSLWLCKLFFALALALSVFREVAMWKRWRVARYIPSIICVAIAFVVPARIPIDMFVGSLVLYLWRRADPSKAPTFSMAVASGMICGDGLGMLLSSTMALMHARAPICIKFMSRTDNVKLDAFLATLPVT
ncbi:putative metal-nicotianamine transporter YSL7 [Zea mays]|uniref:Putative metal-nicotianamine transporter YSL7 n=1 Tax=Zea mays TaxID=4577 RepID=A0A1D6QUQ2_MAIZE|nr:putative metal-nicotianamine transporter YSL7 [Zea mays]